jgi:osmoprotectant transport system ATP-binding protein
MAGSSRTARNATRQRPALPALIGDAAAPCGLSVVEFRDVSYHIANRPILKNLTLSVAAAETLVLLGRSGSGKTTALKMVNAMAYPSEGQVLVDGKPTTAWDPVALRRHIGYVIQEGGLFPHWTVARNIGVVPRLERWEPAKTLDRVRYLLTAIGLPPEEYAERRPRQLSGGQRQRVGVARALAADPPVLLFDEPFGALDPITRLELQTLFLSLSKEFRKTALFVTHDVAEALLLATRIALLDGGELAWIGPARDFRKAPAPQAQAFLAFLRTLENMDANRLS